MAQFKFRDYSLTLEFPDCTYTITANSDLGDAIKDMRTRFDTLQQEYASGKTTKQEAVNYVCECIDKVLGDGAVKQIFAGREVTLSDAADVLIFITKEVTDHNKKMAFESMNREQRRAASKK